MSLPEGLLWKRLRNRQFDDFWIRRQHPIGPYILDFYCDEAKLAIEVDGHSHGTEDRPERDARRDAWLEVRGIRTLRLRAQLVLSDMDVALATLRAALSDGPLHRPAGGPPPPTGEEF